MIRRPPISTTTDTLVPYSTLYRSPPAAAEAMRRQKYGRDIRVWPATSQPIGFPIRLVEPYTPRRDEALGYDMYSERVRREAMRRAWQTGQPATSGIVQQIGRASCRARVCQYG